MGKNREGVASRIPVKGGSPAARLGVEELKGSKPHPWVPLVPEEVARGGGSVEDGGLAVVCNGGDGAPVANGRREAAKKMREGEVKVVEGVG